MNPVFQQFKVGYDKGHVVLYCKWCYPWDMRLADHSDLVSIFNAAFDHLQSQHPNG